jgi:hypothetical protein
MGVSRGVPYLLMLLLRSEILWLLRGSASWIERALPRVWGRLKVLADSLLLETWWELNWARIQYVSILLFCRLWMTLVFLVLNCIFYNRRANHKVILKWLLMRRILSREVLAYLLWAALLIHSSFSICIYYFTALMHLVVSIVRCRFLHSQNTTTMIVLRSNVLVSLRWILPF